MNFFNWIRDGVRNAVLLGVSDAVDELGSPHDGDDMNQRLLTVIRKGQPLPAESTADHSNRRRKLGRTLEEIQASASKAS